MNILDIIAKKRDGYELDTEEIKFFIDGYVNGTVADYQASAMTMAIYLNGMTKRETLDLTLAMRDSGDVMDLSSLPGVKVDKHSTGGVGDKTTLIIGPIAASCGVTVAKMSGKGLGHTGGTIDKLESVPGVSCEMEYEKFLSICKTTGIAVAGQTHNLVPADKKLYALRDVTSTVGSMPLIASSIMSKKLASGADALVLDVKYGSGAFMPDAESASLLATEMLDIAKGAGLKARAVISDMEIPLGTRIGNLSELYEAQNILKTGTGDKRLIEIALTLASNMIDLAFGLGIERSLEMAKDALYSGKAYGKFIEFLASQGADKDCVVEMDYKKPAYVCEIKADKSGFITRNNALSVGKACCALGAGRIQKTDIIDPTAGITILKPYGSFVQKGEVIAKLYNSNEDKIPAAREIYLESISIEENEPQKRNLIYKVLTQ